MMAGGSCVALRDFCSMVNSQHCVRVLNAGCELRSDTVASCRSQSAHLSTSTSGEGHSPDYVNLVSGRNRQETSGCFVQRVGGDGSCAIGSGTETHFSTIRSRALNMPRHYSATLRGLLVNGKVKSCRGGVLRQSEIAVLSAKHGRDAACTVNASIAAWSVEELVNSSGRNGDNQDLEGPSCLFVGPLEVEKQDRLEALYMQARDAYYSGTPLILDEMFDRVENRLRWFGSKLVLKYPRCSLKKLAAYSDAESDQSQMWALAGIWFALLMSGVLAATGPAACSVTPFCRDAVEAFEWRHRVPTVPTLSTASELIAITIGLLVGIPLITCAARSLSGMVKGELVALKGSCPNCGEEVYAFVRTETAPGGRPRQKTECHVCERPLVFHANLERSTAHMGHRWAYGRVYLIARPADLAPKKNSEVDA